mgnify:FL=1
MIKMPKIAYYPGNVARAASMEVEDCIQPLCKTLGIELIELPEATSDGGNIIKQASSKLQHALVARNLALAEEKGLDIMTTCATSHGIMKETMGDLKNDPVYAAQLNNLIARSTGVEYRGEADSWHLLHYLVEEIGLDKVTDSVINPIELNIAPYYGPNMQRAGFCAGDDPFMPNYLEQLISAIGGTPVNYDLKCQSVGAPSLLTLEKPVMSLISSVISDAKSNGAELIVSACTVSHANLDSYQTKAGRKTGKNTSIPVIHLAELIAFAFGHFPDRLAQLRTRAILIGG